MNKKLIYLAVILITAFFVVNPQSKKDKKDLKSFNETRGIFISYIEYMNHFTNKTPSQIKEKIKEMITNSKINEINTIYLQVRPFSDSIYNSSIFPFSHTVSGKQGKSVGFDLLEYFIQESHNQNIKVHAWINPYRISNQTDTNFLSKDNPAYKWLNTNNVKIIENKGIFYNPASNDVKELIIKGIEEITRNYDVDGILLDDYFYPDDTIDLENYKEIKNTISITDFRLGTINNLIKQIYTTIKKENSNILFGISPDGNIENNYNKHYADVKRWLKEDNYIDYIMPQLYYGFKHDTKPFIKTLNEWNDLITNNTKLIVALALYKVGEKDNYAGSGSDEWQVNDNIINNQILVASKISNYRGYSLFRYDFLKNVKKM